MAKTKSEAKSLQSETATQTIRALFIIGLILVVASAYLWWRQVGSNPRVVFETMLENSLKTSSVSRRTTQQSGIQELDQVASAQLGDQKVIRSLTELSQTGSQTATVKTETIGTPTTDFVRYTSIETNQTAADGRSLDFSEVIGVWGRTSQIQPNQTTGELYGESVLGIVPFGNVPARQRQEIMNIIKDRKVYETDYSSVQRQTINGRPTYAYEVAVNPENYVVMLQAFARATGLNQLESLQPESFRGAAPLNFRMRVDVLSRQLTDIEYVDSQRQETYTGYGAQIQYVVPESSISVQELQSRLQAVE